MSPYEQRASTPSLLLDDGGAHIVASAAQAEDLLSLFRAHGIACQRSMAGGPRIQLPKADQILRAHALLQEWLKGAELTQTLDAMDSASADTQLSSVALCG